MEKRYWAFIRKTIRGPFPAKDIASIPGFSKATLISPEKALGQWREARLEEDFKVYLDFQPIAENARENQASYIKISENKAAREIVDKAIAQNAGLENEVRKLRKEYETQKKNFSETINKKNFEIKALAEKVRNLSSKIQLKIEHPSWEMLYKELKKRSDEKISELIKENAQKNEELNRTKNQIQSIVNRYEENKNLQNEKNSTELLKLKEENMELKNLVEEKEISLSTMQESVNSLINKSNEFQKILLDERADFEKKSKEYCDEIGKLRAENRWKSEELDNLRSELKETAARLKEIESMGELKTKEQEELFNIIHGKIKILTDYFENLEVRMRFSPKKAES